MTVDPQIDRVPNDAEFAGNTFKQGCTVKGRVEIFGVGGQATVGMNRVALDADLDKIVIGNENLFCIASATDAAKGPHLSYSTIPSQDPNNPQWPSLGDPHFDLDAKVTLLGLSANANIKISTQQLTCAFSMGGDGVEVSGSASFPSANVSANVAIDAGGVDIPLVGSIDIGKISAGLTITAEGAAFDDFNFSVLGVGFRIPGTSISIPVGSTLTGLADQLKNEAIDQIKNYFGNYLDPAKLAARAAEYLKDIGYDIEKVLSGDGIPMGGNSSSPPDPNTTTSQQISDNIRQFYEAWKSSLGYSGKSADEWCQYYAACKFLPTQLVGPLKQNGYPAGDIAGGLYSVYGISTEILAVWLARAGYDSNTVADFLRSELVMGLDDTVKALRNAGYATTTEWPVLGASYVIAAVGQQAPRYLRANADNSLRLCFVRDEDDAGRVLWQFAPVGVGGAARSRIKSMVNGTRMSSQKDGRPVCSRRSNCKVPCRGTVFQRSSGRAAGMGHVTPTRQSARRKSRSRPKVPWRNPTTNIYRPRPMEIKLIFIT